MINTVADMLQTLKKKEEEVVYDFQDDVGSLYHPTIIGDMYEGIAEKLLDNAIFKDLDLRVVSGQIINKNKDKSAEVDIMIVEGEGFQIPNTNRWIYDISQVLAVIEVKKNLYKSDLIDSYNKMKRIVDIFDPRDMSEGDFRLFRDSFRSAMRMDLPNHDEVDEYDLVTQMVYHSLLMESVLPLRVVFGFYGYKDMINLRNAFSKFLEDNVTEDLNKPKKGFNPVDFPNLIFTRNSSILKLDGVPYQASVDNNGFWDVYVSSDHNPLLHLLEMLWTRINYKYKISPSQLFGEDLEMERLYMYLRCRPIKKEETIGWEFTVLPVPEDLGVDPYFIEWEPAKLSEAEHLLVVWLCHEEKISTKSDLFDDLLKKYNLDEESFIKSLNDKKLIFKDKYSYLRLLTDECAVVFKNGNFYAGENKDGKVSKWVMK